MQNYIKLNRYTIYFIGLILFHSTVLLLLVNDISISYKEVSIFYLDKSTILSTITNTSCYIFGQNDFAIRVPFILFYIGSSILMYLMTHDYFKLQRDRLISLSIFMILPGVNSSALVVNESILVIFFTLFFIYLYKEKKKISYPLLILYLFIDNSFAILFLSLFFYAIKKKDNTLITISLVLFGLSMTMYGFDVGGVPRGYFLDTFFIYAVVFSPVLFLYFFYSLYRIGIKYEKDLFWYISFTALWLSLVLSLRQKIEIEEFAPFVVIAVPIMVKLFIHSLRIRLKEFRVIHHLIARVTLFVLILNFVFFVFNKYLYLFIDNPTKHFVYKNHIVKELAYELNKIGISSISSYDKQLELRLKFYGIEHSDDKYITPIKTKIYNNIIDIKYKNKLIKRYYIVNKLERIINK